MVLPWWMLGSVAWLSACGSGGVLQQVLVVLGAVEHPPGPLTDRGSAVRGAGAAFLSGPQVGLWDAEGKCGAVPCSRSGPEARDGNGKAMEVSLPHLLVSVLVQLFPI